MRNKPTKIPLLEADFIYANEIISIEDKLEEKNGKLLCHSPGGSHRRRCSYVGDVDAVVCVDDLKILRETLRELGYKPNFLGKVYQKKLGDVLIDMFISSREDWAGVKLWSGGSELFNILFDKMLRKKGFMRKFGIISKDGNRIYFEEEESIFSFFEIDFIPEYRRNSKDSDFILQKLGL